MERLAGRLMILSGLRRLAVSFLAGLLAVLALPPIGLVLAPFLSFTLLVWLLDGASASSARSFPGRMVPAFAIGWAFGFGYFLGGLWWLGNALLVEADLFAWAIPLAVLGLPAVLALYYGLAAAFASFLWSDGAGRLAALAVAFGLAEWLRSILFTGFPWNAIGYAAMPVPELMQSAGLLGLAAINALAVLIFAAPALLATGRGARLGIGVAVLLALAHGGYGLYVLSLPAPTAPEPQLALRLVQPAVDQAERMDDARRHDVFEAHLALTASPAAPDTRQPDIIIWPETSIPFILTENPDALLRIADVLKDGQVLIAGAVRAEDAGSGLPPRYYNSIYVIDSNGLIVGAADKTHLVPFGEYLPFQDLLVSMGLQAIAADMPGGFSAAATRSVLTLPGGRTFYPLICYEAIFPEEIGANARSVAALLNLTNDAWFGNTPGPFQHFQQARLRAVETGTPLIRAANNGISALVDARGLVTAGLAYGERGFVDALLPARQARLLPQEVSQNFWILTIFLFMVAFCSRFGFNLIRK